MNQREPWTTKRVLCLATQNSGKAQELSAMLADVGIEVKTFIELLGRRFEVEETESTFEGNARLKAEAGLALSGIMSLADDSGLEVDALGGRPGVYSARYAGQGASDQQNVARLLEELDGVPLERRTARFVCVLALARPGEPTVTVRGVLEGTIALQPHGARGFGYDPVFVPSGPLVRTLAELSPEEKNALSHRGEALRQLRDFFARSLA